MNKRDVSIFYPVLFNLFFYISYNHITVKTLCTECVRDKKVSKTVCIVLLYLEKSQVRRRNSVIAVRGRKQIFKQIQHFTFLIETKLRRRTAAQWTNFDSSHVEETPRNQSIFQCEDHSSIVIIIQPHLPPL